MIPSTLFALVAALSSVAAVNGAVIQRDGTFTYLTPQPTAPGQGAGSTTTSTSSQTSKTTSTQSTTSTTSSTTTTTTTSPTSTTVTTTTTSPTTTTATTTTTSPTTNTATTTPTPSTTSTRSTAPTTTSTIVTVVTQPTTSVTPCPVCSPPVTTTSVTTTASPPSTTPCPVCTPTSTSTPAPSPGGGVVNCNGVQQWQASLAYTAGDRVIFNGQLFTAKQWTYNNAPPAHLDQWIAGGTCAQPVNNQANCNGVAAWQSTVAYTAGSRVTFNGHLWSAVQWTQSNSPGDTSGSWKDQGACA